MKHPYLAGFLGGFAVGMMLAWSIIAVIGYLITNPM